MAQHGPDLAQHGHNLRSHTVPYRQALRIMPASVQHGPPWVCAENLGPIFPHHKPNVAVRLKPLIRVPATEPVSLPEAFGDNGRL